MNVVDAKNQSTHEFRVQSLKSLSHTRLPLFCFFFFFIYIYTCIYTFRPPKVALNYSSRTHARIHSRVYIYIYIRMYVSCILGSLSESYTSTRHCLIVTFWQFGSTREVFKLLVSRDYWSDVLHANAPLKTLFSIDENPTRIGIYILYFTRNREIIVQILALLFQQRLTTTAGSTPDFWHSFEILESTYQIDNKNKKGFNN